MTRTKVPETPDEILWMVIRKSTSSLGFNAYQSFMDQVFGNAGRVRQLSKRQPMMQVDGVDVNEVLVEPFGFSSLDAYKVLRVATEAFVVTHCGVLPRERPLHVHGQEEEARFGHQLPHEFER